MKLLTYVPLKKCKGPCDKPYPKTIEFWRYRENMAGLDYLCRSCRKTYDAKYRKKKIIERDEIDLKLSVDRQSRKGFTKWMKENPVYFASQFGVPATDENIESEYTKILSMDAIAILMAAASIGTDKVRCY